MYALTGSFFPMRMKPNGPILDLHLKMVNAEQNKQLPVSVWHVRNSSVLNRSSKSVEFNYLPVFSLYLNINNSIHPNFHYLSVSWELSSITNDCYIIRFVYSGWLCWLSLQLHFLKNVTCRTDKSVMCCIRILQHITCIQYATFRVFYQSIY